MLLFGAVFAFHSGYSLAAMRFQDYGKAKTDFVLLVGGVVYRLSPATAVWFTGLMLDGFGMREQLDLKVRRLTHDLLPKYNPMRHAWNFSDEDNAALKVRL